MHTLDHTNDDDFNGTVDANTILGLQRDTQFARCMKIVFYSALLILGVLGNLLIIVVIARHKHLRTKFNFYVVNLAVCDLLVAVTCPWVHLVSDLSPQRWPLGEVICKVHTFVQVTMICSSIFTLCTLTLDRYMAITSPGCLWLTQKYQPLTIVIIWVCSLGVSVPWIIYQIYNEFDWIGGHEVVCEVAFPSLAFRRTYYVCFFVLVFIVPVLLMLALLVTAVIRTGYARPDGSLTTEEFKRSQRMAQYFLFTVIVLFCVCWAPQQALLLWDVYRDIHVKPPGLLSMHFAALYVAYSSSAINPIIYFLFSKCFRETVKGCCACRRHMSPVAVEPLPGTQFNNIQVHRYHEMSHVTTNKDVNAAYHMKRGPYFEKLKIIATDSTIAQSICEQLCTQSLPIHFKNKEALPVVNGVIVGGVFWYQDTDYRPLY